MTNDQELAPPFDLSKPDATGESLGADDQKRIAGEAAAQEVARGMAIGLGTGSTARYATAAIGRRLAAGEIADIAAVATSDATTALARELRIPIVTLAERPVLDIAIDGADEISPQLDLVKGLGAALVREKIVAAAALRFVVVADHSKLVSTLGSVAPLPLAVVAFGWTSLLEPIRKLGGEPELRKSEDGEPVVTDDGLLILDCRFQPGIGDPVDLDTSLKALPGVVETGLFLSMAERAYVGSGSGLEVVDRPGAADRIR